MNKDLVRATGLWENEKEGGETYLSGTLGGLRILIFRNTYKDSDRSPTHALYIGRNERRNDNDPKS